MEEIEWLCMVRTKKDDVMKEKFIMWFYLGE